MEAQLTSAIHSIMMDRDTTLMDKEEKVIEKTTELTLGFVAEALLQLGFTKDGLRNNLGIKNFLRDHHIHPGQFNVALEDAQAKIKTFKQQSVR